LISNGLTFAKQVKSLQHWLGDKWGCSAFLELWNKSLTFVLWGTKML
jgi:hypothetical protein